MAQLNDKVLEHAEDESDGIEEYDNPLPDWWVGLFVGSIIFAAIYPFWYHGMGHTQVEEYDREMAAAAIQWPKKEMAAHLNMNQETLDAGEQVFQQTCASCHKPDLTGSIGPNLIDDVWIHGSTDTEILTTITEGVKDKGMPAWGAILGPKKVEQVAAFVVSKRGTGGPATPAPPPPAPPAADDGPVDGEKLFMEKCAVCHKPDLTGQVGPNLIDDTWIHGGELAQIQHTITVGVPEKGMISWGPLLSEAQIEAVAQFVHGQSHPD